MVVSEQERLYSADDFWEIAHSAENEDRHLELIEGMLHEMSPAGEEHGDVAMEFGRLIANHVKANNLGRVTAAETGYILRKQPKGKDTVLAPDVGFISRERAAERPSQKFVPFAPDLAVEVVSPSDSYTTVRRKIALYLRYGTKQVWLANPELRTVEIHTTDGIRLLSENDTLDGGDILPGFTVKVGEIFG